MNQSFHLLRWRYLLVATILITLAAPSGVASAQYGGTSGVVINPPVILSGDAIDIIGSGCNSGETVSVTVPALGEVIATTIATGENGDFIMTNIIVTAPIPGIYPVEVTCGDLTMTAEVTVVDSEAERAARQRLIDEQNARDELNGPLALTGSELTTQIIRAAAGFLTIGVILALSGWRRREETAPANEVVG